MPATIFSGDKVKALKSKLKLGEGVEIISTTLDPSSGAGLAAPIGTIALNETSGAMYQKTGAGDTAWVVASLTGALPTAGGTMTGNITFGTGFGDLTSGGLVAGKLIKAQIITSTSVTTYTPTSGTRLIELWAVGGGGGSGGITASAVSQLTCSQPGMPGTTQRVILDVSAGGTATIAIGAGGSAGAATGTNGGNGGQTTFTYGGTSILCPGGQGGIGDASPSTSVSYVSPSYSPVASTLGTEVVFAIFGIYGQRGMRPVVNAQYFSTAAIYHVDYLGPTESYYSHYFNSFANSISGTFVPFYTATMGYIDSGNGKSDTTNGSAFVAPYAAGQGGKNIISHGGATASAGLGGNSGAIYVVEYA